MGYDRNKAIQIATAEVGYLEKSKAAYTANPAILDEKIKGAGYDNYTKYGRDMHSIYPSVMDFHAAWCDAFVDWCFYKAYGVATAKSLLGGNFDDYTVASAQMYKTKGALDNVPEVGSQIFFSKSTAIAGIYHTGLVIAVSADKKTVTTVEGNTSASGSNIEANGGCVAKKTRAVSSKTFFGHPAYNDKVGDNTGNKAGDKMTPCAATVKVNTYLNVRTGPGTSYSKVTLGGVEMRLPKGMVIAIDKEQDGFGELSGTSYWVSLNYVQKG